MSKLSRAIKFIMAIWLVAFCLAIPQAIQFGLVPMYGGRLCTVNLNLYCVFRLLWFGRELRTSYGVCYADGIDIIWFENKWGKYLYARWMAREVWRQRMHTILTDRLGTTTCGNHFASGYICDSYFLGEVKWSRPRPGACGRFSTLLLELTCNTLTSRTHLIDDRLTTFALSTKFNNNPQILLPSKNDVQSFRW